jgi:hypothetical protein
LSGAVVEINVSNGEAFTLVEDPAHPGQYQTPNAVAGVPGLTYQLTVKADVNPTGVQELYSATSTMPEAMPVDSIRIKSVSTMGNLSYELSVYAQNPPDDDYYLGIYEVNDSIYDKISKYSLLNDDMFNGQYMDGWSMGRFGAKR